ncbi:elongation factor P maturation arginine rhamnosyltransferase EarP [Azohydromonas caseinilytica]|uniref:Protein-arginine rhamnosyltransferase n=1 Tax=Azohydromonas caseinilytica TaxID=2728836 RepID=A0A848F8I3_9BURK|nr:elongation factor P maturation arginine rhamnosyltransferase EarP [Azohydromonas caseinilytica]NML14560.1 elongation factor P maturation arginine rhamnosyltransferase EarP [Azohydromonas caseinilytica]
MLWDLFCRVIDNHGDLGVGWRLAADLADRGERARLWVDDASALAWMAPQGHPGVEVLPWREDGDFPEPGEVVVELFGCDPPAGFVARMAAQVKAPVWINLEYLSAEAYVERSHGLQSPQFSGPGAGLVKFFFYPGFTPATGGLLRERDLPTRRAAFDRTAWLDAQGTGWQPRERVVSLFCYRRLPALWPWLAERPTLLLAAPGAAQADIGTLPEGVRLHCLPWLTQRDYDHLLWASDLNFVRGEDSFVRAQWANEPFVWQIYEQHDGVHAAKLQAFLDRFLQGCEGAAWAGSLRRLWGAWNGLNEAPPALPDEAPWRAACARWRQSLENHHDLTTQLQGFVAARR